MSETFKPPRKLSHESWEQYGRRAVRVLLADDALQIPERTLEEQEEVTRLLRDDPEAYGQRLAAEAFGYAIQHRADRSPAKWCYLGGPASRSLDHALMIVREAFGEVPYVVGSCLERPDFRDVDVRIIFDDAKFAALFGGEGRAPGGSLPLWSLLTVAISEYLSKRTGLNIDFQIQQRSNVSDEDWAKVRDPATIFPDYGAPPWFDPA